MSTYRRAQTSSSLYAAHLLHSFLTRRRGEKREQQVSRACRQLHNCAIIIYNVCSPGGGEGEIKSRSGHWQSFSTDWDERPEGTWTACHCVYILCEDLIRRILEEKKVWERIEQAGKMVQVATKTWNLRKYCPQLIAGFGGEFYFLIFDFFITYVSFLLYITVSKNIIGIELWILHFYEFKKKNDFL